MNPCAGSAELDKKPLQRQHWDQSAEAIRHKARPEKEELAKESCPHEEREVASSPSHNRPKQRLDNNYMEKVTDQTLV